MNVLFVNHTILKSGAAISLSTLIRHLPAKVRAFFVLRTKCQIGDMLGAAPAQTFRERYMVEFMTTLYGDNYPLWLLFWHVLKIPIAILRMQQLKRRWQLDLVHANETNLLIYVFAARLARLPVVLHARTAVAQRPFERFLLSWIGRLRGVQICAIDGEVKASLPESARRITRIIYNPIDLGKIPDAEQVSTLRRSWGFSPEHIVIGQVASLHKEKGIWMILELAETLCTEFPLLRFVFIGDNSASAGDGPQLFEAIKRKNLSDRISLPGYETNLALAYGALDIALCLFNSLGGVGRTAYEAALAGKPLVATLPDPANSETLRQGVSALILAPSDKAGISDALRSLILSPSLCDSLGRSAKMEIGKRHDPNAVAKQVMDVYTELLN